MEEIRVKRGDTVKMNGRFYKVTAVENYGFFVKGRNNIILHSDEFEIVEKATQKGQR